MSTYVPYHLHTYYSLLDSCSSPEEYIKQALEDGVTALSFSEHGKPLNWVAKKIACDNAGIKYIHSVEIYLTESFENRVRDNYHTVLVARNEDGVRELNELVSISSREDHFYYVNRLSFDEFLGTSDNIISTSACLASPLSKLTEDHPYYERLVKKYDFLEVQGHMDDDQIAYNRRLLSIAKRYNKPLIAGTDTHSVSKYKSECRDILLEAKHKKYDDDAFDLTWKTRDELSAMFYTQGVLSQEEIEAAIDNTNVLADMVEPFKLDTSFKYPLLYGSAEADADKFVETVERKFQEKISRGVIPEEQVPAFRKAIDDEMSVFQKLGMCGFMLSMSEILSWCREQDFAIGPARGSVGGSRIAYVADIIDLNPETWKTNFYRFANPDRVEPGDIDVDVIESDRPKIFEHIVERFGKDKTARVAAFGTLASRATIDEIARCFRTRWENAHQEMPNNPWSLQVSDSIKQMFEIDPDGARAKYPELFYYYDGLFGTVISQSVHPAGMVISSYTLDDNFGVFLKDGERCLVLDMDNAHEAGLIKYDLLVLKTVQVIRETCKYIGIPYPKTHEVDWNDKAVWDSMISSPVGIFQMEGSFAYESLRRFRPQSIFDITLVTACIRPSGASYRNDLLGRKIHHNASEQIDELLSENLGYLVYQEDIINFLMNVCGLSGGEADTVRRGIAKKKMSILEESMPKILDGYCSHSDKPREEAEEEAKEFLKIIEDASAYMFGYNHAIAYSLLSYLCAYYRYYYPHQFITAFLNCAANDDDIVQGTAYARKVGIQVTSPKWGVSQSDYSFDVEKNVIAKGLSSVKFMSKKVSDDLYHIAHSRTYDYFIDVLEDLTCETQIDSRQVGILIKLDFFSEFGNQRELLRIDDLYRGRFKCGDVKTMKNENVDGTFLEPIIKKYSTNTTKSGERAKSYTLTDVHSALIECEETIKAANLQDLSDIIKIQNFKEYMGYVGYQSGRAEDRPKLFILEVFPLKRKKDGSVWAYAITTKSIGSGIETRWTVMKTKYEKNKVSENDIILCRKYHRDDKGYFMLDDYIKYVC